MTLWEGSRVYKLSVLTTEIGSNHHGNAHKLYPYRVLKCKMRSLMLFIAVFWNIPHNIHRFSKLSWERLDFERYLLGADQEY